MIFVTNGRNVKKTILQHKIVKTVKLDNKEQLGTG